MGKLGWSLRRIERAVHIGRQTAAAYLKAAATPSAAGGWGRLAPAKPAIEAITDFGAESSDHKVVPNDPSSGGSSSTSASEAYHELIELGLSRGRNARAIWQDLVDAHGFTAG